MNFYVYGNRTRAKEKHQKARKLRATNNVRSRKDRNLF